MVLYDLLYSHHRTLKKEKDGWCHYCDLVYQSDDSSFDMLSGYGIDSILNVTDTVMDLCRDY